MEGQVAKRRRVYSVEPNQIVQSIFTRNYLNHLVPALVKMKEKDRSHCDINRAVKYEVDMAMVLSAQGFAWSNGLKVKLQNDRVRVNAAKSSTFLENGAGEGSSSGCEDNEVVPMEFSSNPSSKPRCKDMSEMKRDLAREDDDDDDDEDGDMEEQWKRLRRLIPGGEKMCDEQMAKELESYISCLQMQVNALQFLLPQTR
ncbi:transcription factor bHLH146-like isoform X2 [Vigna unguiculata]|uniref:transcription factor bHLH146-like isoform X2 n=1 Tax=Vigna unguiculata TaxID=3917 RepID=UPI001016B1D8|nr:transcription factor bHLH146-like isoform X2 [Vigna unguiculata]